MYRDYIALTNNSAEYLSLLRPFNLRNGLKILVRNVITIWVLGRGAFHVLCYLKLYQLRIALILYPKLWNKSVLSCIIINLALWSWNHLIVLHTNFQVHFQTDIFSWVQMTNSALLQIMPGCWSHDSIYWCTYASPGLNELINNIRLPQIVAYQSTAIYI